MNPFKIMKINIWIYKKVHSDSDLKKKTTYWPTEWKQTVCNHLKKKHPDLQNRTEYSELKKVQYIDHKKSLYFKCCQFCLSHLPVC